MSEKSILTNEKELSLFPTCSFLRKEEIKHGLEGTLPSAPQTLVVAEERKWIELRVKRTIENLAAGLESDSLTVPEKHRVELVCGDLIFAYRRFLQAPMAERNTWREVVIRYIKEARPTFGRRQKSTGRDRRHLRRCA
jgi:hypothetical protein